MPTFMTISVFCYMNNLRKVIFFYLPSDLLLNKEAYVAFFFFFLSQREFLLQIISMSE